MKRRLRRIAEDLHELLPGPKLENPALFPGWVWCRPPAAYDAPLKRGELFFKALAEFGVRVEIVEQVPNVAVPIWRPWTYLVCSVPTEDWSAALEALPTHCSVIMDCHFPIMNMETAIGNDADIIDIIDRKPTLLANLALADAVTVPQRGWAADLAEVNPNVFLLPDFDIDHPEAFSVRMVEIAQASVRVKQGRLLVRQEMGL